MTDQEARSAAQTDCPGCDDSTCTHREGCILDEAFDKADERSAATITHGRHCTCSACERQDWTEPQLACCGMHGPICPPVYAPLGAPGQPDPSAASPYHSWRARLVRLRVYLAKRNPYPEEEWAWGK